MIARIVKIISRRNILQRLYFRVEEVHLQHEMKNGQLSRPMTRLCLHRGNSVGMLLHEATNNCILFIEQFRFPTYDHGLGWLLEIPAGIVKEGDSPRETARRETLEETGYDISSERFQHIAQFYPSPGGSSEIIDLFYAQVTPEDKKNAGGGVPEEDEDIRLIKLPVTQIQANLDSGKILDAKTIIGLQWLLAQQK